MIAADLAAAVALVTVPLAWALGRCSRSPSSSRSSWSSGSPGSSSGPTFTAHLPDVVPDPAMTEASSRFKAAESVAMLAGPTLGGSLVQLLTAPVAVLRRRVLVPDLGGPGRPGPSAGAGRLRAAAAPPAAAEIGEGMGLLWRDRRLRAIAGAAANLNFFGLMVFALLVVYLTRDHDFTPADDRRGDGRRRCRLAGRCAAGAPGRRADRPRPDDRARVGRLLARDDRLPGRAGPALAGAGRSSS